MSNRPMGSQTREQEAEFELFCEAMRALMEETGCSFLEAAEAVRAQMNEE